MTFFVGNLVEVGNEHRTGRRDSDGGRAYILAINNDDNNDDDDRGTKRSSDSVTYKVEYVVGGTMSPNVKRRRISSVIMETTARQQPGETASRPSLLSRHHIPTPTQPRRQLPIKSAQPKAQGSKTIFNTHTLIHLCHQNTRKGNTGLLTIKKMNSKKQKGWLRLIHSLSTKKQLSKEEKSLCISLFIALRVVAGNAGALVAHAWGVTRQSVSGWGRQTITNNMDFTRKVRKDKGEMVFTSHARRKATFTPQHAFNKMFRARNQRELVATSKLKKAWAMASDKDRKNATIQ